MNTHLQQLARIFCFVLLLASVGAATAGDLSVPEPPALPDAVKSGETLEPEVSIVIRDDATVAEYRINGNLYMVKITPNKGKPYYLIDHDGDGEMESRVDDIYQDPNIPQWVLFSW